MTEFENRNTLGTFKNEWSLCLACRPPADRTQLSIPRRLLRFLEVHDVIDVVLLFHNTVSKTTRRQFGVDFVPASLRQESALF